MMPFFVENRTNPKHAPEEERVFFFGITNPSLSEPITKKDGSQ